MYQLLVKYGGWEENQDRISRIFEYTEHYVKDHFYDNSTNRLIVDNIKNTPAIFISENNSDDAQMVKFGYINNIRLERNEYIIHYYYENNFPQISNSQLFELKSNLGIDQFEFSRTHWSFKDIDLFKVLYQNNQNSIPSPSVFDIESLSKIDENLLSIMMPFDQSFNDVHNDIKNMITRMGLTLKRADNVWEHHTIIQDIVTLICKSKVVLCDCTNKNPNVFYELGIAHALGKETIIITQNDGDIPFDLRHHRYIKYLNNSEGRQDLLSKLQDRINQLV